MPPISPDPTSGQLALNLQPTNLVGRLLDLSERNTLADNRNPLINYLFIF